MTAERRGAGAALAAIVALAAIAYAPVRGFPYVQDAYQAVQRNPVVERGNFAEIFASDYWKDTVSSTHTLYRPVTVLSFALERTLLGRLDSAVSHLVNVALHAGTTWLLFLLARALGLGALGAAASALVFAVHPLLLQAVANVVGRADLLVALFGVAAALVWVRGAEPTPRASSPDAPDRARSWGAAALTFLALASKEIGVAIPALLVALEGARIGSRAPRRTALLRLAPFAPIALAVLVYLHLRTLAIGEFPGAQPVAEEDNVLAGLDGEARWATALAMLARYAALFLWPARSSPDYSGTAIPVEPKLVALAPLVGLMTLSILVALALRPWLRACSAPARAASAGGWLTLLPYAVVGNLVVLNAAGFAERMVYVPATGACLLLGIGLEAGVRLFPAPTRSVARHVAVGLVALAVVGGVWSTRRSVPMWESGRALFEHARRVKPRSLRAGLERATRLEAEGRLDEALDAWRSLTEVAPGYGGAWMSTGVVLARLGRLAEAEDALRRSVALRPEVGEARMNLALVLAARGARDEAERELRRALLLDPALVEAAAQLAHLRFDSGRYAEAARLYRGCVELGREDLRARWREAEERAARAARSDVDSP